LSRVNKHVVGWTGAAVTAGLMAVSAALATDGSGVSVTPIAAAHYAAMDIKADMTNKSDPHDRRWDLLLKTKDYTIMSSDWLTVEKGGHTGWHSHPGPVFGTVISGSVIVTVGNPFCPSTTYTMGQSFYEAASIPHRISNASASQSAEFVGFQIRQEGSPKQSDQSQPVHCT
jgi:quercetin dioxygenase-like cupin family protein